MLRKNGGSSLLHVLINSLILVCVLFFGNFYADFLAAIIGIFGFLIFFIEFVLSFIDSSYIIVPSNLGKLVLNVWLLLCELRVVSDERSSWFDLESVFELFRFLNRLSASMII